MSIKIVTRQVGDVTVLDAAGRITLGEDVNAFRDAIHGLLAQGEKKLLLNLAEVTYVDSSGIGGLISVSTAVANQGGKLKLLNLTKRVQDLLQITKTSSLFDIYSDEAAALASLSA